MMLKRSTSQWRWAAAIPSMVTLLAAVVSWPAGATVVGDYTLRNITEMFTYEDYGGGDVVFRVDVPITGCEGGFWLRPTDAGFKGSLATLLLARAARTPVRVWAHNDQLWSGSAAPTCRLSSLGLN